FRWYARALGDEYVRKYARLRAGELWSDRLRQLIEEADVFQLFWSSDSMLSPFVKREWEYALSLRRPNFVRPVYWDQPLPTCPETALPPGGLRRCHFQRLPSELARLPPPKSPLFHPRSRRLRLTGPCAVAAAVAIAAVVIGLICLLGGL